MRTNLVADFKEIGLKVTSGIDGYITNQTQPSSHFGTGYYYVWSHLQNKKPTELAYNKNGDLYQTSDNPLAEISPESGYLNNDIMSVTANLILDWAVPWLPGLKFKALGRYRINSDKSKQWVRTAPMYDIEGNMGTLQNRNCINPIFRETIGRPNSSPTMTKLSTRYTPSALPSVSKPTSAPMTIPA